MSILDLIDRIGEKESSLTEQEFISPVFSNTAVATRVEGMVYTFSIPRVKPGWYKIRPEDTKSARIIGPADLLEIEQYLKCLGKLRVVLVLKRDNVFQGLPDKANKYGFPVQEMIPVYLTDDMPMDFDRVAVRFDGANFWYESLDQVNDPAKGEYLRDQMQRVTEPEKIRFSGLTIEEKLAYTLRLTLDKKLVADRKKDNLKRDVEFAGGQFVGFHERQDHYSVTYKVEGQEFTSHISKDPRRMVISAGLCLNGSDQNFDLKSLVTVIREAQNRNIVHHHHLR